MMYEVFDSYLNVQTWHTNHDADQERFFRALAEVVHETNFSPDEMGAYMRTQKNVDRDDEDQSAFNHTIDHRVTQAWAIRDYLQLGL